MYFITPKKSKTGQKFQKIYDKRDICFDAQEAFSNKYKFKTWRHAYNVAFGGMCSCADFEETPNPKIWGKGAVDGEYFPKKNSNEGKAILNEIRDLPTVSQDELNMCIGFDGAPFKTIGFCWFSDEYFGFSVGEKWHVKIPDDCEEVTTTKYRETFYTTENTTE